MLLQVFYHEQSNSFFRGEIEHKQTAVLSFLNSLH